MVHLTSGKRRPNNFLSNQILSSWPVSVYLALSLRMLCYKEEMRLKLN